MNIEISQKELKENKLKVGSLQIAYLLAIRNKHPDIFQEIKKLINFVEDYKPNQNENKNNKTRKRN